MFNLYRESEQWEKSLRKFMIDWKQASGCCNEEGYDFTITYIDNRVVEDGGDGLPGIVFDRHSIRIANEPYGTTDTTRSQVYRAIDSERNYQDEQWRTKDNESPLTVGDSILCLEEYALKARQAWSVDHNRPEVEALHMLRKCAAICVNAMEIHGAHNRESD